MELFLLWFVFGAVVVWGVIKLSFQRDDPTAQHELVLREQRVRYEKQVYALQHRINDLEQRLDESRHETKEALTRRNEDGEPEEAPGDRRFRELKKRFALMFHPDHIRRDDPEKAMRSEVFKEFWAEIERIEKEG